MTTVKVSSLERYCPFFMKSPQFGSFFLDCPADLRGNFLRNDLTSRHYIMRDQLQFCRSRVFWRFEAPPQKNGLTRALLPGPEIRLQRPLQIISKRPTDVKHCLKVVAPGMSATLE
jgi:hypothetical protein